MAKREATKAEISVIASQVNKLYGQTEGKATNYLLTALDWLERAKAAAKS